jgi:hypothetical protein
MEDLTHYPFLLFAVAFPAMWVSSAAGLWLRDRQARAGAKRSEDFDRILTATLTLLALIIGFTFSMSTGRYEQRKSLEEAEANAIGTEYLRADLLPAQDAANVRKLLLAYLDQRIAFYVTADPNQRAQVDQRTDELQAALWTAVRDPASAQPTPLTAMAVAGMNDVSNAQGYTQAAMWNRIPIAAWLLMAGIAVCSNVLLGFGSRSSRLGGGLALILPLIVSTSFLLIADIDAPRHGLIRVSPQNLQSLAQSLRR